MSPRRRLLCFPYAGGSSHVFRSWGEIFSDTEVCVVTLPGREMRYAEPSMFSVQQLGAAIAHALSDLPRRPWVFYGHSMGALLAFETARALRRLSEALPRHLFIGACRAPHRQDSVPVWHTLPDEELLHELRRLGGTDEGVLQDSQLIDILLPIFRSDARATELYCYGPERPLAVPITAFYGSEDSLTPREDVRAWAQHTSQRFDIHPVNGGHLFNSNAEFTCRLSTLIADVA